jgi:hypothetical protein
MVHFATLLITVQYATRNLSKTGKFASPLPCFSAILFSYVKKNPFISRPSTENKFLLGLGGSD